LEVQVDGQVCEESISGRAEKVEATFAGFIEAPRTTIVAEMFGEKDSAVRAAASRLDRSTVAPGGKMELILEAVPDPEFHVYRLDLDDPETKFRTLLTITQQAGAKLQRPIASKSTLSKDLGLGQITHFYEGPVTWRIPDRDPRDGGRRRNAS
jgi:hypothetical protein